MKKTIYDYPTKEILLVDLIKLCGGKTHYRIVDDDTLDVLYDGRAEYIEWTADGCVDPIAEKVVVSFDALYDGIIEVNVKEKVEDDEQTAQGD